MAGFLRLLGVHLPGRMIKLADIATVLYTIARGRFASDGELGNWANATVTLECDRCERLEQLLATVATLARDWAGYLGRTPSELPAVVGIGASEWAHALACARGPRAGLDWQEFTRGAAWSRASRRVGVVAAIAQQVPRTFSEVAEVTRWLDSPAGDGRRMADLLTTDPDAVLARLRALPAQLPPGPIPAGGPLVLRPADESRPQREVDLELGVGRPDLQSALWPAAKQAGTIRPARLLTLAWLAATDPRVLHHAVASGGEWVVERGSPSRHLVQRLADVRWWTALDLPAIAQLVGDTSAADAVAWANGTSSPSETELDRLRYLSNESVEAGWRFGWRQTAARTAWHNTRPPHSPQELFTRLTDRPEVKWSDDDNSDDSASTTPEHHPVRAAYWETAAEREAALLSRDASAGDAHREASDATV